MLTRCFTAHAYRFTAFASGSDLSQVKSVKLRSNENAETSSLCTTCTAAGEPAAACLHNEARSRQRKDSREAAMPSAMIGETTNRQARLSNVPRQDPPRPPFSPMLSAL